MNNHNDDIIGAMLDQVRATLGPDIFTATAAQQIEQRMRCAWGGQEVYVKKRDSDVRAAAVRAEFDGCNRRQLQVKYGISRAQFYKIVKGG